jgi:3-deoxy-7-phosphoheptulonate synthase
MRKVNDLHIKDIQPLIAPRVLKDKYPLTETLADQVFEARERIKKIIRREDPRLLGIIGPCSIHDTKAAMEYAERLIGLAEKVKDEIFIVMRVYFEKPRTTIGWRGLIVDPEMDGSNDIGRGLEIARSTLIKIGELGLPTGSEMLDPYVPQYIDDLVSWAAIGARTTESQTHRNLASGLSMPVGFKNGTSGNLELAINAMESAIHPASFIGIDQDGNTCVFSTTGNDACHMILRGGRSGPNYHEEDIEDAEQLMREAGLTPSLVVDCSHGNSGKKSLRQSRVLRSVIDQVVYGEKVIAGFMLESNLFEGRQDIPEDLSQLKYGVSVTDECIGWEETEKIVLQAFQSLAKRGNRPV